MCHGFAGGVANIAQDQTLGNDTHPSWPGAATTKWVIEIIFRDWFCLLQFELAFKFREFHYQVIPSFKSDQMCGNVTFCSVPL